MPFASSATRLLVLARTGSADADLGLFLVDPSAPGVSLKQQRSLAADTQYDVRFAGVRVPAESRIGAAGTGWATWDLVMHDAIILLAAWAIGGAERALEITVQYAKDREQFDKPLGAFQAISHYLADAATLVDGGKTLVYEAAWARAAGKPIARLAPMAKLFACQTYRDVTAMCQQVWGGVGFTIEYDIQLFFRRAKQLQITWWDTQLPRGEGRRPGARSRRLRPTGPAFEPMPSPTPPPLSGLRVIECSLLGPGAVTTHLADLGADVIKIEAPQGDYIREMTWPIVRGVSLLHLHVHRGKRSAVLDLRNPEAVAVFLDLVRGADAVAEAMRPGSLARRGLGFEQLRAGEPADRLLQRLGLRHDGAVSGPPGARHRLRHLGGARESGHRRGGLLLHPRASVDGNARRAALRSARDPGGRRARARDRSRLRARDRAVRRRRLHGLVPDRELEGLRSAPPPT